VNRGFEKFQKGDLKNFEEGGRDWGKRTMKRERTMRSLSGSRRGGNIREIAPGWVLDRESPISWGGNLSRKKNMPKELIDREDKNQER
jgi:hypothetical protein